MISLLGKEKFISDLAFTNTNIHPVVVIEGDNPIYLSQNEEVIEVDGVNIKFEPLNLNVPSIKESLDLENRKITTSNITITLSNYTNFSDLFSETYLLNNKCSVYWKSQSCISLTDCLLIYSAYVKRVDHDTTKVKIMLEDTTDEVFHREIPAAILPLEKSSNEESEDIRIPFTYGEVDKAPCVLWEKEGDSHIYAITDDINSITNSDRGISINGVGSKLYVYDNGYGEVLKNYEENISEEILPANINQIEYENGYSKILVDFTDLGEAASPAAFNFLQSRFDRKATSVKLLDGTEEDLDINGQAIPILSNRTYLGMGTTHNFLGEEDGYYISNERNIFNRKDVTYNGETFEEVLQDTDSFSFASSYASLPAFEVGSVDDFQEHITEQGELFIKKQNYKPQSGYYPLYVDINTPSVRSYQHSSTRLFDSLNDDAEFIYLPNPNEIYEMFKAWWYDGNSIDGYSIESWDEPLSTNHHMWGHAYTWEDSRECMNYSTNVINYEGGVGQPVDEGDLYFNGDVEFPRPLFRFTIRDSQTGETFDTGFVTFNKNPITGEDISGNFNSGALNNGVQDEVPFLMVDFWDLLENYSEYSYRGVDGQDMPRFHVLSKTNTETLPLEEEDDLANWSTALVRHSYEVGWNGVSVESTYPQTGGYHADEGLRYVPWKYKTYQDWFQFFGASTPFVLMKKDRQLGDSIIFPQGLLIPTVSYTRFVDTTAGDEFIEELNSSNGNWTFYDATNYEVWGGFGGFEGAFIPFNETYLSLECNNATVPYDEGTAKKIGMVFTFQDISPSGIMDNAGKSTLHPAIKISYEPNSIDTSWGNQTDSTWTGAVMGLYAFAEVQGINLSYTDWYDEGVALNYFDYNNAHKDFFHQILVSQSEDGSYETSSLTSMSTHYWANPSQYNSIAFQLGTVRANFAGNTYDANPSASVNLKIYGFNVSHLLNIINIKDKTYNYQSFGRVVENNNARWIVKDIIEKELNIYPSFNTLEMGQSSDWDLAFSIKEAIDSKNLIEDICRSTPYIVRLKTDGALEFTEIRDTSLVGAALLCDVYIKSKDIIKLSFTRTKLEKVKTLVKVFYGKDYNTGEYNKSTYYTDAYDFYGNGDLNQAQTPWWDDTYGKWGYKKSLYGLDPNNPSDSMLEFKSDYIRNPKVANNLRDFLLAYHCNQHNILKIKLPLKYIALEIGDVINIDSLVNGKKCFGEDYTEENTRNGQVILPYFILTNVNKSLKSIDIVCEQLHELLPTIHPSSIRRQGSGNILRTKLSTTEEDVIALQEYLDGENPYFTEVQMANADLNLNYSVDEGDLALLIEDVAGFNWEDIIYDFIILDEQYYMIAPADFTTTLHAHDQVGGWGIMQTVPFSPNGEYRVKFYYPDEFILPQYNFLYDMSIFYDNPNAFNCSAQNPFEGWYMKVGDEWMIIHQEYTSFADDDTPLYTALVLYRGQFDTEITTHADGDEVLIFFDYPLSQLQEQQADVDVTDYDNESTNDIVMESVSFTNLGFHFTQGQVWGLATPIWHETNFAVGEIINSDSNVAAYMRNNKGAIATWSNGDGTCAYMSTGVSPFLAGESFTWYSEESFNSNTAFIFHYSGALSPQIHMDSGQVVNIQPPIIGEDGSFGEYRSFAFNDFIMFKDNINNFSSYNVATDNPNYPSGIMEWGYDSDKLDKNGNPALYMTVRLEDFFDESGFFIPSVGDRYVFVESKLYGSSDGSFAGVGWHYTEGEWGINPATGVQDGFTSQSLSSPSSHLYDPAEAIEIKQVYLPNDVNTDMQGTVVIYRHMIDINFDASGGTDAMGYGTYKNDFISEVNMQNYTAEPITNYVEGAHFCGSASQGTNLHLLLKLTN